MSTNNQRQDIRSTNCTWKQQHPKQHIIRKLQICLSYSSNFRYSSSTSYFYNLLHAQLVLCNENCFTFLHQVMGLEVFIAMNTKTKDFLDVTPSDCMLSHPVRHTISMPNHYWKIYERNTENTDTQSCHMCNCLTNSWSLYTWDMFLSITSSCFAGLKYVFLTDTYPSSVSRSVWR